MNSKANIILLGDSTIDNILWIDLSQPTLSWPDKQKKAVSGCLKEDLKTLSTKKPQEKVNTIIDQLFEHIVENLNSDLEYKND